MMTSFGPKFVPNALSPLDCLAMRYTSKVIATIIKFLDEKKVLVRWNAAIS
jgi:hypothetical protein